MDLEGAYSVWWSKILEELVRDNDSAENTKKNDLRRAGGGGQILIEDMNTKTPSGTLAQKSDS